MHRLEKKLSSLWKESMVSQPDIAVILEAGHADLFVHSLPLSLSLELSSSIDPAQPAASRHGLWYPWARGYTNEGLSAAEWWIPVVQGLGAWCQGQWNIFFFCKAEELKMKTHPRAINYLQDSEVLEPSEVHLGDPGDIISVQVTAMESKFRSDFCGLQSRFI